MSTVPLRNINFVDYFRSTRKNKCRISKTESDLSKPIFRRDRLGSDARITLASQQIKYHEDVESGIEPRFKNQSILTRTTAR